MTKSPLNVSLFIHNSDSMFVFLGKILKLTAIYGIYSRQTRVREIAKASTSEGQRA